MEVINYEKEIYLAERSEHLLNEIRQRVKKLNSAESYRQLWLNGELKTSSYIMHLQRLLDGRND